ncbi:MAG: hypothetical protein EA379_00130, partial [Phycisphaerales bacterium]
IVAGGGFTFAGSAVSAGFAQFGDATNTWKAPVAGQFDDPTRWLCGRALSAFDDMYIDAVTAGYTPAAFTIAFPGVAEPIRALRLFARSDIVSINLAGQPFEITNPTTGVLRPGMVVGERPDMEARLTFLNSFSTPASVSVGSLVVADQPTASALTNRLAIESRFATLDVAGEAFVGRRGDSGELFVQSEGKAVIRGAISIGTEQGAKGEVRVTGLGAQPSSLGHSLEGRSMAIGESGEGLFRVGGTGSFAGASAYSLGRMGTMIVGTNATGVGTATVQGAGSSWMFDADRFIVGLFGQGTVNVVNGALLDTDTLNELTIGANPGSTGLVDVRGAGSRWIERRQSITVGPTGTLAAYDGGTVEASSVIVLPGGQVFGDGALGSFDFPVITNVLNLGSVRPELASGAPGTMSVVGNYFQVGPPPGESLDRSGRLVATVGPVGSSRLEVQGIAELGGALQAEFVEGYTPQIEDPPVEVLTAAKREGRFDVAFFPGLPPDAQGRSRYMRTAYADFAEGGASVRVFADELFDQISVAGGAQAGVDGLPQGVVVGDFDGFIDPDGNTTLDIAISVPGDDPDNDPGQVVVLFNAGTSGGVWQGFTLGQTSITVGVDPRGLAVGDFNGNTLLDIAVANRGSNSVTVLSNNGLGGFVGSAPIAVGQAPVALAAADFNNSGAVDLAVANSASNTVTLLQNSGSGAFATASTLAAGLAPSDVRAGTLLDLDNDKWPDLVVVNAGDDNAMIFGNNGSGQFVAPPLLIATGFGPAQAQIGDLDNDKWPDLVIIDRLGDSVTIAQNNADGSFAPSVQLPIGEAPRSLALVDLNANGLPDIAAVVTNDEGDRVVRILRNDTDGDQLAFAVFGDEALGAAPLLVASGDLNANGADDLIVIGESSLLRSDGARGEPKGGLATGLLGGAAQPCPGDANGDGVVDFADLSTVLGNFGQSGPNLPGDLTGDGEVNFTDLSIVLSNFGNVCR